MCWYGCDRSLWRGALMVAHWQDTNSPPMGPEGAIVPQVRSPGQVASRYHLRVGQPPSSIWVPDFVSDTISEAKVLARNSSANLSLGHCFMPDQLFLPYRQCCIMFLFRIFSLWLWIQRPIIIWKSVRTILQWYLQNLILSSYKNVMMVQNMM